MATDAAATISEILAEEMGRIDGTIERLNDEIERLNDSIIQKMQKKAELEGEQRALNRVLERLIASEGTSGLGPTEAIARVVQENNGKLTRSEVFSQAVTLIRTPSARPRKVIDSTYRNLLGKRYEEHDGKVFLRTTNGNGHAP